MRLVDRFNPLFALAIDIHSYSVSTSNKNALKEAIFNAVSKEQSSPVSNGITLDDMDLARTAVYFFIDEVLMDEDIISLSQKASDTQTTSLGWYQNSLQNTFMNTEKGGELFFIYFEQVLDKILSLTAQTADKGNTAHDIQTYTNPQIAFFQPHNLNEKFLRASQLIAGSLEDEQNILNENINKNTYFSAIETLEVYAKCLLYGFRGKYYGQTHHTFLQELRQTAYAFLQIKDQDNHDVNEAMYTEATHTIPLPTQIRRKATLGYFFYFACPPLLCAIWYFYCAQTVSQILF